MAQVGRRTILTAAAASSLPFARARAADPLLIAVATPMTGSSGAMGLNGNRGAEIATAAINAAGGIGGRPVKFELFDDGGTPKDAATVAQRITNDEDKYFAVCGHVNSSATLAAMPIYSEAGDTGAVPVLVQPLDHRTGLEGHHTADRPGRLRGAGIFRLHDQQPQEDQARHLLRQQRFRPGPAQRDRQGGRRAEGRKIVAEGTFTPNVDRDFQPVITQMKAAGVEGIMLMTEYTEGGLFLAQAKDLGLAGIPIVGPDSNLYDKYIELSLGNAEGTYVLAAFDPYADKPITESFIADYRTHYNALASQVAVFTHDIFWIIKEAVDKHGATRATLIDTVKAMEFDGVGGHYAWTAKGDTKNRTHFVLQVKGPQFVSTGIRIDETGLDVLRKA